MSESNKIQIGGTHYQRGGGRQHWDYVVRALKNRYLEGNATKYICRPTKGQEEQDILKCIHYIDKLREEHAGGLIAPMFTGHIGFGFDTVAFVESYGWKPWSLQCDFLLSLERWGDDADLARVHKLATTMLKMVQNKQRDMFDSGAEPGKGYVNQD